MESRKVKGWRSRLQEQYDDALTEVRSLGADNQGARKAGAALDWSSKKDALFYGSDSEPARPRNVSQAARSRASEKLHELVKTLLGDRRERARIRASQWYHSRTKNQLRDRHEKAKKRRIKYRDRELMKAAERRARIKADDELREIEREKNRDRWEEIKANPAKHEALLQRRREKRKAKMQELRSDPVAHAAFREKANEQHRAWKEQNREKYLSQKRRDYRLKKAKGSDPA